MKNISGCLICYNEEKVIRRALESLSKVVDEIVLYDSFSTDKTLDIAKEFGCTIYQHEFDNHRNQKNRAIEKCTKDWIFLIDADEYLEQKLIDNVESLTNNTEMIDAFTFPRKNYIDNDGPQGFPDFQTRLFRNYVRHFGHPFHHRADGNSKRNTVVMDKGCIMHKKTLQRQEHQNRLYYSLRPQDYNNIPPNGAEDVVVDPEATKDAENVNVYKDFILKNKPRKI